MFRKYAYGWITLGFFLGALLLHWYFGWRSFIDEAQSHGQAPEVASYMNEMLRDTFGIGSPSSCSFSGRSWASPISSTSDRLRRRRTTIEWKRNWTRCSAP